MVIILLADDFYAIRLCGTTRRNIRIQFLSDKDLEEILEKIQDSFLDFLKQQDLV